MLEPKADIFSEIALHSAEHARFSSWYGSFEDKVSTLFAPRVVGAMKANSPFKLGEFGEVVFPWLSFGSIDSSHLFGLDELILFSFYWTNRHRYKSFLDLGANVGLHTLVASLAGMKVTSVEPDPVHLKALDEVISANHLDSVEVVAGAATAMPGPVTFLRVEGNSTGSHIRGAKSNPYGELTEFEVPGIAVADLIRNKDLVKMDVEGLEAELLAAVPEGEFSNFDLVAEIGTVENAAKILHLSRTRGFHVFAQKADWAQVTEVSALPHHHSEGSVFISTSSSMPWS